MCHMVSVPLYLPLGASLHVVIVNDEMRGLTLLLPYVAPSTGTVKSAPKWLDTELEMPQNMIGER